MAQTNEQWNDAGDCSICRRRNYCSKTCKRAQARQQNEFASTMTGILLRAVAGVYSKDSE